MSRRGTPIWAVAPAAIVIASSAAVAAALARQAITGDCFLDAGRRRRKTDEADRQEPDDGSKDQEDQQEEERPAEKAHQAGRDTVEMGCGDRTKVSLLQSDHGDFKSPDRKLGVNSASEDLMPPNRSIVLVGLMGAGKSSVGKRLAQRLALDFVDADHEIERAASCTIEEIFARFGEAAFRDGERRVICRLLEDRAPIVLATGGGAFMDPETRACIRERGVSVWLRAELDVLFRRVARRTHRPLLKQGNPRDVLERLMALRYPVYAQADLTVESDDSPAETTVDRVIEALSAHRRATSPALDPELRP